MSNDFGRRLRDERKRFGLNQTDFGKICGVTKTAQLNYEAGERSPNVDYWQALSAAGADVQYILTGIRTNALAEQVPGYAALRPDQIALLDNFLHCAPEDQDAIKRMALLCAHASEKKRKETKERGKVSL